MATGHMLGNYEILSRLAQGGMGEILLARQRGPGGFERLVIIKTLLPELTAQQDFLDQFLDEARLLANLSHPNVVTTLELGVHGTTYFLAMEFIRGVNLHSLQELVTQQGITLPPRVIASIIRDASLGLAHAHSAVSEDGKPLGIVHRDISPHNIMVNLDGMVKVVDFGLARAAVRSTRTAAGVVKGKFRYMAPEQLMERPVDARTDQFALGIVAWELLTGQPLFAGDGPGEAFAAILNQEILPPSQLIPDVPTELDAVVMRMLRREPDARFARCEEVARALRLFLSRDPTPPEDEVADLVQRVARDRVLAVVRQANAPRPVRLTCPHCTAETTPDARFCPQCGNRLGGAGSSVPPTSSSQPPAPVTTPRAPAAMAAPVPAPLPAPGPAPAVSSASTSGEAPRWVTLTDNPVLASPPATPPPVPPESRAAVPKLLQDGLLDAISGGYDAPSGKPGEDSAIDVSLSQVSVQLETLEKSGRFRLEERTRPGAQAAPAHARPSTPDNTQPHHLVLVYAQLQGLAELANVVSDRAPALQQQLQATLANLCKEERATTLAHNPTQLVACLGLGGPRQVDGLRGVRLARAIQSALDAFNKEHQVWCTMTAAVTSGVALLPPQPDLQRMAGLPLVSQARLLAQDKLPNTLLMDVHTARLLGPRLRVEGDSVMVANPGHDAPLEAVRVAAITQPLQLAGRTSECSLAAGLAAAPPAGLAGVVWTAPPGMGRSALLQDAARTALDSGALVAQVAGGLEDPPSSHLFARALVQQVLAAATTVLPLPPHAPALATATALGLDSGLAETIGAWLAASPAPPGMTPAVARNRLEGCLTRLLRCASRVAPLWLVLDDLHLADPESLELLGTVLSRLASARLVVLGSSAVDVPAIPKVIQRVPLKGLGDDTTLALAQSMGADASWARTFTSRVGGNPGLLRLLCTWLRRTSQGNTLPRTQDALQSIPSSAQGFPRWLVGGLSPAAQHVVGYAAVGGMAVQLPSLERALPSLGVPVRHAAQEVLDAGILVQGDPQDTLHFTHAFMRFGVLQLFQPQELTGARAALARELAAQDGDPDARERAVGLRGPDQADLPSLQAAAQSHAARTCHSTAVALLGRGVSQASKQARTSRDPGQLNAVLLLTRDLLALWRHTAAVDAVKLLPRLLTELTPTPSDAYALAVAEHVRALLALGRVDEADTVLDHTLEQLPQTVAAENRATLLALLADVAFVRGDAEGAVMQLTSAFQVIGGRPAQDPLFYPQHLLALASACARAGRAKESREYLTHAARQAALAQSAAMEGDALYAQATAQEAARDTAPAALHALEAMQAYEAAGHLLGWATAAELRARLLMRQGEAEAAAESLGRVVEAYQDLGQAGAAERASRMRSSAAARQATTTATARGARG